MNVQSIVLLMAVMAVGSMGAASQAFAAAPLDIEVNGDTFDHTSTIVVDGQIGDMRVGTPVTLIVSGQTGVVTIEQITPSSDGSFSFSINTASPLMKYDGEYKIKATYGPINQSVTVTLEGGKVREATVATHTDDHSGHEAADLTNELNYNISGGNVESITSTNDDSLLITIHDAEDGSELTITLPDEIITPFNDGTFFVLVNGEESDDAEQNGNTITIPFDADATDIEIVGHTCCVPEFGTIAMIVLAVAIVSIIAVSAKSRLSIMPRI